jgi:radical SAM superfamily enzyme YgiQ (UPF0313 family)
MRIVFVDNLLFESTEGINRYTLQPHLGLISMIAVVEGAGHEGLLFDPKVEVAKGDLKLDESLYWRIAKGVLSLEPEVVGFTSLGCNFICTLKVAQYIREWQPELPILLGGPHATVLDRAIMSRFRQFDVIVRNEAELKILPVLEALASRSFFGIPGITFRMGGQVWSTPGDPVISDLDSIPIPAYYRYPIRELGLKSIRVDAGRGCPFECTFCSTASFFGRKYRLKSANRLVQELDQLHATYGVSDFSLTHDLFTVNRHKVMEFCEAVQNRGYTWKCSARMDCVNEDLLERMSASGCRSIYYGIEAGSARMQKISKKHLNLSLFDPILNATQRLGMSATVSFITGYPEELEVDQNATLDMIGDCFGRDSAALNVQLHLLTPEPGTELLTENRDRIRYDGHISDFNFPSLESDDGAVIERNPEVFINHHYFPAVLSRRRHIFVTSIYQTLYSLGFPLLRYMLKFYRGKLSVLVDAMRRWVEHGNWNGPCDGALIVEFLSARHGEAHHLTGLVRYMSLASKLRSLTFDNSVICESNVQSSGTDVYQLSSWTRIARRVPDCPRILEHLIQRRNEAPPASLLRQRFDFLLQMERAEKEVVTNFALTAPSVAVLEYFVHPRTRKEYESDFSKVTGYPAAPLAFIDALIDRGVLKPLASRVN